MSLPASTAPDDFAPPPFEDDRDLATILATIPDAGIRRQAATRCARDRRAQLETYAAVYAETYGHRLELDRLLGADELYVRLSTLATA